MPAAEKRQSLVAIMVCAAAALLGSCSFGNKSQPLSDATAVIGLNAPFTTTSSYVGEYTERGTILAVEEINAAGGVVTGNTRYKLEYQKLDSQLNEPRSVANTQQFLAVKGLAAVIEEGVGAAGSATATDGGHIPHFIVGFGSPSLIDGAKHPSVFRVAPRDSDQAKLLTKYATDHGCKRPAVFRDDTSYGKEAAAIIRNEVVADQAMVATEASTANARQGMSSEINAAQAAQADCAIVYAFGDDAATAVKDIRAANYRVGSRPIPIYASPSAEFPLTRIQLKDHRDQLDGLTFVSFKQMPDSQRFLDFERKYAKRFGVFLCGCKDQAGQDIAIPSDWDVNSYDAVYALKAAMEKAGTGNPSDGKLVQALSQVKIKSGNGRDFSFSSSSHEAFAPQDLYLATMADLKYEAVKPDYADVQVAPQTLSAAPKP
jgi:branched-chain amino acid transport system substrate-binding protein